MTKRGLRQGRWWLVVLLVLTMVLAACGKEEATTTGSTPIPAYGPNLSFSMPNTLTGGPGSGGASVGIAVPMAQGSMPMAGGDPCMFNGAGNNDPFKNGHMMTKFLVGAVASWHCITDRVIDFVDLLVFLGVPTDGTLINLGDDPGYQAGDATWLQITESGTVTTVTLHWTTPNVDPDPGGADIGFNLYWDTNGGNVVGRLVADLELLTNDPLYEITEDPKYLRLDFNHTSTSKTGDMYIGFDGTHVWATGWRIQVVKALDGSYPTYTAKGALDLQFQWDPGYRAVYTDQPSLRSFAVANSIGVGAAIAQMQNLGVMFAIPETGDNLGAFLFTKDDTYYFGGGPQYIDKSFTAATYKNYKSIIDSGAGDPIPNEAAIDTYLAGVMAGLTPPVAYSGHYAACTAAPGTSGTDCINFLTALFSQDAFGGEGNVGTEPVGDPRVAALAGASWFANACPPVGACTWDMGAGNIFEPTP